MLPTTDNMELCRAGVLFTRIHSPHAKPPVTDAAHSANTRKRDSSSRLLRDRRPEIHGWIAEYHGEPAATEQLDYDFCLLPLIVFLPTESDD